MRVAELLELVGLERGDGKRYPGREQQALHELSLEIPGGTFCVLVGPSGGGKTTALKMVNRLVSFDDGDIRIDGRSVRELPVVELRRGIGYVIQQVGLFPHMTVGDNVATALRRLALRRVRDVPLGPVRGQSPDTAHVAVTATVRNAVSLMLEGGKGEVTVVGDDGAPVGVLTLERATALLRE